MRPHLPFSMLGRPPHGNLLACAIGTFAVGLAAGAMVKPRLADVVAVRLAQVPPAPGTSKPMRLDAALVYPAEVLRVIDGDTFQARVRVWPGLDVDTKVRLRDIDAAELHGRCADELAKARAARNALETLLADGGVTVWRVGVDKYGGRVDASVSTRRTADVAAALLSGGFARSYDGGRRGSWC